MALRAHRARRRYAPCHPATCQPPARHRSWSPTSTPAPPATRTAPHPHRRSRPAPRPPPRTRPPRAPATWYPTTAASRSPRSATSEWQRRVELAQEQRAPLLLGGLPDGTRSSLQTTQTGQKAAIALVRPPHQAAPPPARLPQGVESPVVADAVARVGLHVVARQLPEPGPRLAEVGEGPHHVRHCVTPVCRGSCQCLCQPGPSRLRRKRQARVGRSSGEVHRLAHRRVLRPDGARG